MPSLSRLLPWKATLGAVKRARLSLAQPLVLFPVLSGLVLATEYRLFQTIGSLDRSPIGYAIVGVIKVAYSLYVRRGSQSAHENSACWPANKEEGDRLSGEAGQRFLTMTEGRRCWILVACVGAMLTVHEYVYASAYKLFYDPRSVQIVAALSTLLVLLAQVALSSRQHSRTDTVTQTLILQLAGAFIVGTTLQLQFPLHLLALPILNTAATLAIELCYDSHPTISFHDINIELFSTGIVICLTGIIYQYLTSSTVIPALISVGDILLLPLRAAVDLSALTLIHEHDSLTLRVAATLGSTVFFLSLPERGSAGVLIGCVISIWAGQSFISSETATTLNEEAADVSTIKQSTLLISRRNRLGGPAMLVLLGLLSWFLPLAIIDKDSARSGSSPDSTQCLASRRPLAFPPPANRVYHHFDDILLVVFFSHARYDVNLEHYRAVYADYFPNMVFVGPKSREDRGFRHSYDVLVDSYQSDEDLRDDMNYKMAGRMAHHMLYTALQEYPCYSGYLWAPFDTFLNIPRLEKFNQSLFWYHSPFAKYVPNVALGGAEENQDPARHPPPANISPDPALNLTQGWRGWGPDWWWGDPNVGVTECMPAFLKTPESQRRRLAEYLDGKTRFIGGSADTVYIPGRHREAFMETLGIFLETNCFLEIAVPTALHLAVPRNEDILFVDHHWIWMPPFNADFVRQQWREGKEVDSFHTFHWGDKQENGVWNGDVSLIEDTRAVLQESAIRQMVTLPISSG